MPPAIAILVGARRILVPAVDAGDTPIVPAEHLVIEIENQVVPGEVILNDEVFPVILNPEQTRGYLLLDRFRSTGFHRLIVGDTLFRFATADAKLELDGILSILEFIKTAGLSWGHQLVFSDGMGMRDPRADFAWLRTAAREILDLCTAIAEEPSSRFETTSVRVTPRGGRVSIAETLSDLRALPAQLLEEHASGILSVAGKHYMPRRVVMQAARLTHDTVPNRRATRLLMAAADLTESLLSSGELPRRHRQWTELVRNQLIDLQYRFPFNNLRLYAERGIPALPVREEHVDSRYQHSYQLFEELVFHRGFSPTRTVSDRFAYIGYSDEIYQAFVAILLGKAFGTTISAGSLRPGLAGPAFTSPDVDIYYDTMPPKPEFSSWRDRSSRPADLTPDYCIINRTHRVGVLADAKYRTTDRGMLPSSSLNDCQVYMQHFNRHAFAVFFPGKENFIREVSGDGNTILEVSVTPSNSLTTFVADAVRPALERIMEPV